VKSHILERLQWPASPRWLALFRIALGLEIFWAAQRRLSTFVGGLDRPLNLESYFPEWLDELLLGQLGVLRFLLCALALVFAAGAGTRFVTPALAIAHLLFYSPVYGRFDAPVPWLYEFAPLIFLCWARTADVWSVDAWIRQRRKSGKSISEVDPREYRWPLEAATCWFVLIYLWAAVAKWVPLRDGIAWGDGGIIRYIMYVRFLDSPSSWVAENPLFNYVDTTWPFAFFALLALVTEVSVILLLVTTRVHLFVLGGILGMHLFLVYIGVFGFIEHALVLIIPILGTCRMFRPNPSNGGPVSASA